MGYYYYTGVTGTVLYYCFFYWEREKAGQTGTQTAEQEKEVKLTLTYTRLTENWAGDGARQVSRKTQDWVLGENWSEQSERRNRRVADGRCWRGSENTAGEDRSLTEQVIIRQRKDDRKQRREQLVNSLRRSDGERDVTRWGEKQGKTQKLTS